MHLPAQLAQLSYLQLLTSEHIGAVISIFNLSYPSTYDVEEQDSYNVFIDDFTGGIFIHVDRLTVGESPESYFDSVEAEKKQISYWESKNITEIKDNDVVIGYEFDLSNVVDGRSRVGKGMIFKKGSFGFYVTFTTSIDDWEENKEMADQYLDSFVLPNIVTGSYSNSTLGISLTLPDNWSLIETGSTRTPLEFSSYSGDYVKLMSFSVIQMVNGELSIYAVEPGTTAEEYIAEEADGASQTPFVFANSASGCEYGKYLLANDIRISEYRYIALASGSKMYYFKFMGIPSMNTQADSVTELARSLVISTP